MRIFRFLALPFALLAELVLLAVCLLMVPVNGEWANALIRAADRLPGWRWYVGK
jgi:hypothetical protein